MHQLSSMMTLFVKDNYTLHFNNLVHNVANWNSHHIWCIVLTVCTYCFPLTTKNKWLHWHICCGLCSKPCVPNFISGANLSNPTLVPPNSYINALDFKTVKNLLIIWISQPKLRMLFSNGGIIGTYIHHTNTECTLVIIAIHYKIWCTKDSIIVW